MLKTLERLLQWTCGMLSAGALFAIMWLTLVDVSGRKFLNHSVPGGLEITEILMVVVIFGALPLVSWRGEHVVFDSLDALIPKALKGVQQRFVHLVSGGVFLFLADLLVKRGDRFTEYGDVTAHLQLPVAPVAYLMAVLLLITALVHLLFVFVLPPQGGAATHEGDAA
jgi:TRAP-type C4-dicarboxylate transport system permease small subunit